jgi:succinyl-diaminopimelate desuccinylase
MNSTELLQKLLCYKSITGQDNNEVISYLSRYLEGLGFNCDILKFFGDESHPVSNLHAIYNPTKAKDILYFAGHTDVVPVGEGWSVDPFSGEIKDGKIYGRGVVDMKGAIASFICAVENFIKKTPDFNFGIGFLITGDEEGDAVNGTRKMLEWMKKNQKYISNCIVGEPTNPNKLGEEIKNGRRGSINFFLVVSGKQGHVAYPENANNPITILASILDKLNKVEFDQGNEFFAPTNLEIVEISNSQSASNLIPQKAFAKFNVRFSSEKNSSAIIDGVNKVCSAVFNDFTLNYKISGESFLIKPCKITDIVANSVFKITGLKPKLTTNGGTSDARFIKDFCPVIECGLVNKTAHQVDENTEIENIFNLEKIYQNILENYE